MCKRQNEGFGNWCRNYAIISELFWQQCCFCVSSSSSNFSKTIYFQNKTKNRTGFVWNLLKTHSTAHLTSVTGLYLYVPLRISVCPFQRHIVSPLSIWWWKHCNVLKYVWEYENASVWTLLRDSRIPQRYNEMFHILLLATDVEKQIDLVNHNAIFLGTSWLDDDNHVLPKTTI